MATNVSVGDVVVCEGTMPIPGRKDGATRRAPVGKYRVDGFFGNYAQLALLPAGDEPMLEGWPVDQLAHERAPQ